MIEMPEVVGQVVRSVGLSTAMRAAGVVTGLLPIPQPVLLVGPGSSGRLGQAIAGFGHRKVFVVTDASGTFNDVTRHAAWARMAAAGAQMMSWFGVALLGVLVLVLMFFFNRNPVQWERLAGAPEELLEPGAAD